MDWYDGVINHIFHNVCKSISLSTRVVGKWKGRRGYGRKLEFNRTRIMMMSGCGFKNILMLNYNKNTWCFKLYMHEKSKNVFFVALNTLICQNMTRTNKEGFFWGVKS